MMPRGDGTGPAGLGPMTGRAAGYCAGFPVPGFMNRSVGGGGFWRRGGFGGGRGWRNWYRATGVPGWARASAGMPAWGMPGAAQYPWEVAPPAPSAANELTVLKQQSEMLTQQLEAIKDRIAGLEEEEEAQ